MKNIHVFAAELPSITVLESKVAEDQGVIFTPLTDSQWSNLGFKVNRQFIALNNGYRIDFTFSYKEHPKAQIIERVNEHIEALGYEPSKEETGKITQEISADFCARSIPKTTHFSAYYHTKKQTLIFDCKAALAQRALGLLLKLIESIETKTLHCSGISNSLTTNMLQQLSRPDEPFETDKLYFAGFEVGDLLVMQNKDKDVARFKGDYPTENIKELIEQGYEIKEIALSKDGISFNLNHSFKIKCIKEHFEVEDASFDNAEDYEIYKQTIALELMTSHCEQLREAFDKQNKGEEHQEHLTEEQDDTNESLLTKFQDNNGNDEFYDEAVEFVQKSQHASVSRIQRKFRIGYNRAARLVEQLEANGIITAPGHNGAREVLVK